MTDDLDSADHSPENDDARSHEKTKRGRLKDTINRTRFMIIAARKHTLHSDKQTPVTHAENDLDDFLAAGRASNASPAPSSLFSQTSFTDIPTVPNDRSTPPRSSTSDSKSQTSPKRAQIPRIDVSASQRFPNAKEIRNNGPVELPGSSAPMGTNPGISLLKPEHKSRSQSTSSLATPGRKERIRNLSVGFADTPPVVIGEGGDEAEAPTVEISRAKMHRARSASPQVRTPRSGPDMSSEAAKRVSRKDGNDNTVGFFNPKPVSRVQTGTLLAGPQSRAGYDTFVPRTLQHNETASTDMSSPAAAYRAPPMPAREKPFLPPDLGKSQKVTMGLAKEFEMSLGFSPTDSASTKSPDAQEPRIFAPKPQRAPPSYALIEGGGRELGTGRQTDSSVRQTPTQAVQPQVPQERLPQRGPQPLQQAPRQKTQQNSQKRTSIIHELPSPIDATNLPTTRHPVGEQQARSSSQASQKAQLQSSRQVPLSSQTPQLRSPQSVPALNQNQQCRMPQRVEQRARPLVRQPISPPNEQRASPRTAQVPPQAKVQQREVPSQRIELPAEPVNRPDAHEQSLQHYPEFENYLNSPMLQDEELRPSPQISRFASLHAPAVRRTPPNSSQEQLNYYSQQPPTSNPKILTAIDTSSHQNPYRSFAQRSKPNSRPTSLYGTPGTPQSSTIRQVTPPAHHDSPSNYSPVAPSPRSAVDSAMPNRMRFYENINNGNPPAGYI